MTHIWTAIDTKIQQPTNTRGSWVSVIQYSWSPAEVQRLSNQSQTHTNLPAHTAWFVIDVQLRGHSVRLMALNKKAKKQKKTNHTPISLNYFLLIWFPACSPTDTRHPAVLQRKKPNREKEGLKLVSLNSPPQLPPMERLKQTQVSLQVLLKSLCSPITHHTHHKDILHLSFVEFVFSPFNLQAV